ncbi:MAG: NAD(P)/FAD-dependent oxidoreductase [Gammaproteobacteria bacterium]|nr:NAD(P)/FAD-dependent oxidoreductase [Gammaproteobacteria bacterium]
MAKATRRSFIRNTAVVGASNLLGVVGVSGFAGADFDVVILGAGMAGLTAARILAKVGPGLKVLVLEARDRVGGRMFTSTDVSVHGVELGAQVIHGSRAESWELIREYGLQTRSLDAGGATESYHFLPGQPPYKPNQADLDALYHKVVVKHAKYDGPDMSYQAFLETMSFNDTQRSALGAEALSWSSEPGEVSARAVIDDGVAWDAYHDEDFQIIGGHSLLAEKMANELEGKIQLSCAVAGLYWRSGVAGVTYIYNLQSQTVTAKRLIITLPVGVLQSQQIEVLPPFPDWKKQSIDSLQMGQAVVVAMLFNAPFWSDLASGPVSWATPDGRMQFWAAHTPGEGAAAITGWFVGSAAQQLSDLGGQEGMQQVLHWLEGISGKTRLQEKLKWHRYQDWVSDPFSLGSYSFTRPGGQGAREILARPIEKTLYFAGEATAPAPHYQTVHGAYMSGKRVAQEVSDSLDIYAEDKAILDALF